MKHIVIPARFSSSRLPGKPLLEIHGRPMILRVVDQAKKVQGFDDLCVATDDERIAEVCRAEGVDVVLTSADHPSGTDRLSEVARIKGWASDDIIVNVQGDEPLLPAQLVKQVAQLLEDQPACSMSTLCESIHHLEEFKRDSIVKVVMSKHNQALYFSRATIPYDRDGAKLAEQKLHDQAYRHLGNGCAGKTGIFRTVTCPGKWSPYCHCCGRSQFTARCRYAGRSGSLEPDGSIFFCLI